MSASVLYPTASRNALQEYVGKSIREVPLPAAVVNLAAVRRNCERMLSAVRELGLGWRAHVKTHKTVEGTRLQVGEGDASQPVKIVVSTLAEAEHLLPALLDWRAQGRDVNVLYGLPVARNAVPRLAELAKALGEGGVSVLLDDPAQVGPAAARIHELSGVKAHAYIKLDMGGRRAGVVAGGGGDGDGDGGDDARFLEVADAALRSHGQGKLVVAGLYSHAGHSYYGDSRVAALRMMRAEMEALVAGADKLRARASGAGVELPRLVVSGGASPTTLSIQNLLGSRADRDEAGAGAGDGDGVTTALREEADALSRVLAGAKAGGHAVEVHAGVYPFLDLQQLATHSVAASRLSWRDVALTLVAEVHSTYPGRGAGGTAEVLVGAGSLALGREACKAYGGMAMLTPWGRDGVSEPACEVEEYEGWGVGRFSQEHGIVTWMKGREREKEEEEEEKKKKGMRKTEMDLLEVGQLVRLWPNHACIAGSHFGWYFVVDEDRQGSEDEIVDVWVRARGW